MQYHFSDVQTANTNVRAVHANIPNPLAFLARDASPRYLTVLRMDTYLEPDVYISAPNRFDTLLECNPTFR